MPLPAFRLAAALAAVLAALPAYPPDRAPVVPNDNRVAGGTIRDGVLHLRLDARLAAWRPDPAVDSAVTVQAFAEEGGAPRIPGPLLRAAQGTEVRASVRNSLDATLVVHGLRAGSVPGDTVHVQPGATREVSFRADAPGTFLYWGSTTGDSIHHRTRRDAQLTGAIVIDPPGTRPDMAERIFVMTVIDLFPDSLRNPAKEDIWELAINGMSWPHTERLAYPVGDTVRWRWVNGSYLPHPMHLHGFHFRVLAKGGAQADTAYAADARRMAVTELMLPGTTFRMDWVPTRAGTWLMHCHMIPHITPYPARADSARGHDVHDVERHPTDAMAGLVLGITTFERGGSAAIPPVSARRMRLFAQQAPADSGKPARRGYVLQRGGPPRADSVEAPSTTLVLTRGETAAITVVNRLAEPTTVHWHGMELESVYDGVSGWSRSGGAVAPLLAPGDSFTVAFTPPRAGTFMYHTHMDEGAQLGTGMYGALLVLEPGRRHDPRTDLVFMIGGGVAGGATGNALNGSVNPAPLTLRVGTTYRFRLVNILFAAVVRAQLVADSAEVRWTPVAKDGADLPPALRAEVPARVRLGVGEAYDFEWTPAAPVDVVLEVHLPEGEPRVLRQPLRVR